MYSRVNSYRIFLMFILALLFYFYEYCLQISPSIITAQLMRDLNIESIGLGAIMAFFFYAYAPLQVPAGVLYDRYNCRNVLSIAVGIFTLGVFLFGLSNNFTLALLGRFFMGAGAAFSFLGVIVIINQWFSAKWYGTLMGVAQLMGCLGAMTGEKVFVWLVHQMSWQQATLLSAGFGVMLTLAILGIVKDKRTSKTHYVSISLSLLKQNFSRLLNNKQVIYIGAYTFFIWGPVTSFAALWGVPFVQVVYGYDIHWATTICSMLWLGSAVGSPAVGAISDTLNCRRILLIICSVLGVVSSVLIIYGAIINTILLAILFFIFGFATGGQALSFALLRDHIDDKDVGTASGINNLATVAGGMILPLFIGFLIWLNWDGILDIDIPRYKPYDYQVALFVIPLWHFCALLISTILLKDRK